MRGRSSLRFRAAIDNLYANGRTTDLVISVGRRRVGREIALHDSRAWYLVDRSGIAQRQAERASLLRERELLRLLGRHGNGGSARDNRFLSVLVRQLVDAEDENVLQDDVGRQTAILRSALNMSRQHDIHSITGKDEARNAADVVDSNGYRAHSCWNFARQRSLRAETRNPRLQKRFAFIDRLQDDSIEAL